MWKKYLKAAGPGMITGAADDDPSGIGTYTMAGAQFGPALLWTSLFGWPLMAGVQMACARVGMVTGRGLGAAFAQKMPRPVVVFIALCLFGANTLNVAADLSAMADATKLLAHGPAVPMIFFYAVAITLATVFFCYETIANVLKWLALFLLAYVIAALVQHPPWAEVARFTFWPHFPGGRGGWGMITAILGTTISPYLFYWQASQEVEEDKAKGRATVAQRRGSTPEEIHLRRVDVGVGTFFSSLVMFFIILTSSLTLHAHGFTRIESSVEAARALEPIAGHLAAFLYTVGLVGTGLLAIPTLTGSAAYALSEAFRWRQGLGEKWNRARPFYSVVVVSSLLGVALNLLGFNPIRALYWSAVVNGALAPFLLVALYFVVSDAKLMQRQPCPPLVRGVVALTAALMFGALGMMVFAGAN